MNADRIAEIRADVVARNARIMEMLDDGKSNRAVADAIGVSIETVRGIRHRKAAR